MSMSFPSDEVRKKAAPYRINAEEYHRIVNLLGREPRGIEWALFSALWSEHCSYKSSKVHLRKFAYRNSSVLESEGENAGVVDLGDGERVAFKMESHNHPSFIEPYQGAATGVGGILRDIFTMGARPIALADYLCFGQPAADRMKTLVEGVVGGISGYGNCVGVPTVTGRTEFDPSFDKNILVNAMAVGLFREGDPIALSKAHGPGNWVVYVGAKTGRDGVHGASMASESFDDKNEAKKPNVQIGDPFYEKLLIEACLEILKQKLVVAMQDMGAAGLTSSSFEMSSKGGVGMTLELDRVPTRDASITPEEILLSESQERMLLVCEPGKFDAIHAVFKRWGLEATKIGEIRAERKVTLKWKGDTLADIDPDLLVENAPKHERVYHPWVPARKKSDPTPAALKTPLTETLTKILSDVRFASREWIYRQYDQRVGLRTVRDARQGLAILRLPDSGRGLAIAVGCRPSLMRLDAQLGAYEAAYGPAVQMAIKGAKVLAITDCLNFGNPEKPEIMSEFVASVEALAEAARRLDAPVISGNVSFYNETLGKNIPPTPATGLIGLRADVNDVPWDEFKDEGLAVLKLGCPMVTSFHRVAEVVGASSAFSGDFDPLKAAAFVRYLEGTARAYPLRSSRMVADGGLAVTLARMCSAGIGLKTAELEKFEPAKLLAETFFEVVVAVEPRYVATLRNETLRAGYTVENLGITGGQALDLGAHGCWTTTDLQTLSRSAWSQAFGEM